MFPTEGTGPEGQGGKGEWITVSKKLFSAFLWGLRIEIADMEREREGEVLLWPYIYMEICIHIYTHSLQSYHLSHSYAHTHMPLSVWYTEVKAPVTQGLVGMVRAWTLTPTERGHWRAWAKKSQCLIYTEKWIFGCFVEKWLYVLKGGRSETDQGCNVKCNKAGKKMETCTQVTMMTVRSGNIQDVFWRICWSAGVKYERKREREGAWSRKTGP